MYRKFLFLSALLITTSVFAFGGGGPGRIRVHYRHGVDAVGVHRDSGGDQGDFCMYDLSGDPNAEEISTGVFQCKGGSILNCDTGVCTPCAAGTYAAAGDESCSTTPAGHYTPEGASAPIPCPDGTYQPEAGQSACIDTEPGYEPTPEADDEVPCSDTTTKGACNCPANQYADGAGNCVPDSCEGVWINECTPSCTQAAGPTHLDDGTGCQDNLGTCQNGVCCAGDGNCATEQYPELYCSDTNNQGQCTQWFSCQEGHSSTNKIIDIPNAHGFCGYDEYSELYCHETNHLGQCTVWGACQEGMSSTNKIIDIPDAHGVCGNSEYPELYCMQTNEQKQCIQWFICQEGQSTQDWIIGTASAMGNCCNQGLIPHHNGTCSISTEYCKTVDGEGNCTEWADCPANASCDGFAIVCNSGYTLFEDECITNDCPGDHQWKRASEDYCKDCSTPTEPQSATTVEDCIGKCVGYRYVGKNKSGDPKCWSCGAPNYSVSIGTEHEKTESSCNACLNRHYSNGHCVCDSDYAYDNNSKCCPPGQHPNAAKTGCCNDGEACDEDVTDCTGKNDGVVCSATDSSLLDNPSHQLPVCINQNCECPYQFWTINEGVCIQQPTGWGVGYCNKLTEKEVACNVGANGQFIGHICVAKDSSFNGVGLPECPTTSNTDICTYECVGSQDVNGTTCCAEFSCGCVSATNNYVYYTDKERTLPYCDDQQTSVSVPAYQDGAWTTTCVNLTLVQNTCQNIYGGACMANVDAGYIGYCEDALVQNHGASCIDPAAIRPMGELPQT